VPLVCTCEPAGMWLIGTTEQVTMRENPGTPPLPPPVQSLDLLTVHPAPGLSATSDACEQRTIPPCMHGSGALLSPL
jgi:hypothetical protein